MAKNRLRTFVAAAIAKPVVRRLDRETGFLQLAGADVKWVAPENMHITVRFIGDVEPGEVMPVVSVIREATEGLEACRPAIRGIDTFPGSGRPPRVIYAGVEGDIGPLEVLFSRLQAGLAPLGFRPESKRYHPHVTLGRVRGGRGLDDLQQRLAKGKKREFGVTTVDRVQLMMSETSREGPVYSVMNQFRFG